jgi:hypothetical protein
MTFVCALNYLIGQVGQQLPRRFCRILNDITDWSVLPLPWVINALGNCTWWVEVGNCDFMVGMYVEADLYQGQF